MVMKKSFLLFFSLFILCNLSTVANDKGSRIDLSGTWEFSFDRQGTITAKSEMGETITLPGTTDTNRKGDAITWKEETTHLSRPFSYKGRAWYRRSVDIPADWAGKDIFLTLERTNRRKCM
jgi:hypothetical protein